MIIMKGPLFVLASKSPRRKQLLHNIGIDAQIMPSDTDENLVCEQSPQMYVTKLALLKASSVAKHFGKNTYVIAADTVVVYNGEIFGKPSSKLDAQRMLEMLSGNTHSVYTGYCVIECSSAKAVSKFVKTDVTFRKLDEDEIASYIQSGEPMDKAGAYGIQGKGGIFTEKIEGDYFNVVGLPVGALATMLKEEFNINILR